MKESANNLELTEEVKKTLLSELESAFENHFDEYKEGYSKEIEFSKNNLYFWVDGWFEKNSYKLSKVYIVDELADTEVEFVYGTDKHETFFNRIQQKMKGLTLDLLSNEPYKADWREENYLTHLRAAV